MGYAVMKDGSGFYAVASSNDIDPNTQDYSEVGPTRPDDVWDTTSQSWKFNAPKAKGDAKTEIDLAAGNASSRYITVGQGQEWRYLLKAKQADDYKAAGYPSDTTGYPMVQAEADATGQTPTAAADNIIATRDQRLSVAAQIEKARISGKAAIDALSSSATLSKINGTRDTYVSQLNAI